MGSRDFGYAKIGFKSYESFAIFLHPLSYGLKAALRTRGLGDEDVCSARFSAYESGTEKELLMGYSQTSQASRFKSYESIIAVWENGCSVRSMSALSARRADSTPCSSEHGFGVLSNKDFISCSFEKAYPPPAHRHCVHTNQKSQIKNRKSPRRTLYSAISLQY